jgi:outer membrane protein TolC
MAAALPDKLTIEHSIELAAARAPMLDAESARIRAAQEDAARAGALPDPELMLGIDNLTITGAQALQLGADEMTMRRIGLRQEWPSRRKRDARTAEANARVDETIVTRAATRLAVERAAANAWIECWVAESKVALLEELHAEFDRAIAIANAQLRGGEGSAMDVLAAKAARAEHENEIAIARADVIAARAGLTRWVGDAGSAPLAPAPAFDRLPIPAAMLRTSLDRQALSKVWEAKERSAEAAVGVARANKRPDLSFGLSYGARSAGLSDMVSFELGIALPLFSRGRQDRDVAARRAELDAVMAEREDVRRGQREALERELARWQAQSEEIARYRATLLPLARDQVSVALAAYSGGAALQPWLDARRQELESRLRYAQTLGELATRWVTLATLLPEENSR